MELEKELESLQLCQIGDEGRHKEIIDQLQSQRARLEQNWLAAGDQNSKFFLQVFFTVEDETGFGLLRKVTNGSVIYLASNSTLQMSSRVISIFKI